LRYKSSQPIYIRFWLYVVMEITSRFWVGVETVLVLLDNLK